MLTGVDNPRSATLAPPQHRPTYIAATLDALLRPYPDVTVTEAGAACADWTARAEADGTLTLSGGGDAIDGLRALAAAAWSEQDKRGGIDPGQVSTALRKLADLGLAAG